MTELLDQFARALATGASRRAALGALLAGSAAALPFSSEAKKNKSKRKKRFKKFQESCNVWCDAKFASSGKEQTSCIDKAKEGKGPCYSATEEGPGFYCTKVQPCGEKNCCPTLNGGEPVKDGVCCTNACTFAINGTFFCNA